jgi:hypothetical protein
VRKKERNMMGGGNLNRKGRIQVANAASLSLLRKNCP